MRFLRRTVLLGLALASTALIGCGRSAPPTPPVEKPQGFVVGVSIPRSDDPRLAQLQAELREAASKHPDLKLEVRRAANVTAQQNDIAEFCNRRVNLLIVLPAEATAISPTVAAAMKLGIPVVVLDRALIGGQCTTFIAADPQQIGKAAGKWLGQQLHGKGNIVEIRGPVDSLWAGDLHTAWRSVMRDPGYRFLRSERVDPPLVTAEKLMSEALSQFKKIDAVFAYDDAAAQSAYQAAKAANREKEILFVGVGGLPSLGRTAVERGEFAATFLHPTGASEAIEAAVAIQHGKPVPKTITPSTNVIAK